MIDAMIQALIDTYGLHPSKASSSQEIWFHACMRQNENDWWSNQQTDGGI